MKKIILVVLCAVCLLSERKVMAEDHEFLEPLALHHAHIENEFRVNNSFHEDVREEETEAETGETTISYKDVFETEMEMGLASEDHWLGVEAHIPFTNEGADQGGERVFGLGDIEFEPIRVAFVNETDAVLTASLGLILPTGDKRHGLGEGRTFVEPHLLLDRVWQGCYLGANLIPGFELGGEREKRVGWGLAVGRSVFSLELSGESSIAGRPEGVDTISLTPAVHFDLPRGWNGRLGWSVPLTEDREERRIFLFQCGTHWE